jgi:hypothetical protein
MMTRNEIFVEFKKRKEDKRYSLNIRREKEK